MPNPSHLSRPGWRNPLRSLDQLQAGQDCPWGYPLYDAATHTFVSQCANTNSAAAVSKPVGLAQPAPAEKFVPCGFGERLDPLALACRP